MNKRSILAVNVMDFLNEFTASRGWVFKLEEVGDSYVVSTTLKHKKGSDMIIAYIIERDFARLRVTFYNNKCTYEFLREKVKDAKLNFDIATLKLKDSNYFLESPMTLDALTLEKELYTIATERMLSMMKIVTDIIDEPAN